MTVQPAPQGVSAPDAPEPSALPEGGRASADAIEPIITESDDGTPFDVEAARARALKLQQGEGGDGDEEEPRKPEAAKPKEEKKPSETEEPEEDPEDKKLRESLTEKDGKLSQDKLERAFASLTKQEKRLKKRVGDFRTEQKSFELQQEQHQIAVREVEAEREQGRARRERAKTNPLEALNEIGWTFEQLTKYVMADGKIPPEKLIADMESSVKERLDKLSKEKDDLQQNIEKQRVIAAGTEYERKLRANVNELLPSYDFLQTYDPVEVQDLVLQIQVMHYEENAKNPKGQQKTIDSKEILDMLENRQAETAARHARRPSVKSGQAGAETQKPEAGKSKPLTNDATAVRASVPSKKDDEDTPFDRDAALKEAIRMTG